MLEVKAESLTEDKKFLKSDTRTQKAWAAGEQADNP